MSVDEITYDEHGAELAVRDHAPVTLFGTDDPVAVIEKASAVARALADVIEQQNLYTRIGDKKHIRVEGWTLLGSMLGVFPQIEWTRQTTDSKDQPAWEARCVAITRDGAIVGGREAMCSRSENRWKNADDYALRSMAQTRAVSGALAAPLRFIVVLAGYEGTPEAEMPSGQPERRQETASEPKPPRTWAEIDERGREQLGDDWPVWVEQVKAWAETVKVDGKMPPPTLLQRMAGVVFDLEETGNDWAFTVGTRRLVQAVFAARLDGEVLPGPKHPLNGDAEEAAAPTDLDPQFDALWNETGPSA